MSSSPRPSIGWQSLTKIVFKPTIAGDVTSSPQNRAWLPGYYKFSESTLLWFKSYLNNRTQQVVINNLNSSSGFVECGVPQGSILGPILFLLFINDLPLTLQNLPVSVDLYANDTTLYSTASDKRTLETNLQNALNSVHIWCLENGMTINSDKTKLMLIASRQKRNTLIDSDLKITFNDLKLKNSDNEKILGVHVDQNFVWNSHFQHVCKKIASHLWLLSQIRMYLTVQHRLLYYNAYIKSHIEYCCIVWGNSSNFNAYKIEKMQRRACKLILGKDYTTLDEARNQLDILSFEETIFIHKAKVMFKIATNAAPIYLTDLFQMRGDMQNLNSSQLNLRSTANRNFLIPKPKISLFKNSLSYSGALVWNSIPLCIKNSDTIQSFSKKCLQWMKSGSVS